MKFKKGEKKERVAVDSHKSSTKFVAVDKDEVQPVEIQSNEKTEDEAAARDLILKARKERKQQRKEQIKSQNTQQGDQSVQAGQSAWNFEADYNDHFETPKVAYQDLQPTLQIISEELQKPSSEIVFYDPYYCQGNMVTYLHELSFPNIINQNRDFYADIKHNRIPSTC
jgi:hypothetical protein